MQFNFKQVKSLLGKVVYIKGQTLSNLEPYVVCGYDHNDDFLQLCSLVNGAYISGLHADNVLEATLDKEKQNV